MPTMARTSSRNPSPNPARSPGGPARRTSTGRRVNLAIACTALSLAAFVPAGDVALAGDAFTITTPYPTVETQAGSTVKFDLDLVSPVVDPVALDVSGVPDGWKATLRGGGFVIHSITSSPGDGATADLEVVVDPNARPGQYPITIQGHDTAGALDSMVVTLDVVDEVDAGIGLVADFPSLSGDPGTDFSYGLTITNNTPEEQTFTFDPTPPQGWAATASPTAEAKAQTVTIDAGGTSDVKVVATPPDTTAEGTYPIDVAVTAANGATGKISLEADVVGTPKLELATADERLDVSGGADSEQRVPLIVTDSGSAPLESVKLAGTAPTGWDVSFDPQEIPSIEPNETAQVTAIVKPSSDAVAGDYSLTVRASAGSSDSSIDLRYGLGGSRSLGVIAIVLIVAAVAALGGVFVKFGRR